MKKTYICPCSETVSLGETEPLMATSIGFGGDATQTTVVDVKENEWDDLWEVVPLEE